MNKKNKFYCSILTLTVFIGGCYVAPTERQVVVTHPATQPQPRVVVVPRQKPVVIHQPVQKTKTVIVQHRPAPKPIPKPIPKPVHKPAPKPVHKPAPKHNPHATPQHGKLPPARNNGR